MKRPRTHLRLVALGLALGFVLSASGFADWSEVHRMFTFGVAEGAPWQEGLRLVLAFAGAVVLAMLGFYLLARRDEIPAKKVRPGTVPGAILFGTGWAIAGTCPAAAFVQIGEGRIAALAILAGMLGGAWVHDRLRKRFGWARHSCID